MVKEFPQLVEFEVSECHSVKNVVFMESMNTGMAINKVEFIPLRCLALQYLPAMDSFCSDIPTSFFNARVSLPNLETLKLSSINLDKIWVDNQHSVANSFQNLANLIVEDCNSLKYLFSPFMVENLKNLKRLEVSKCHVMEEIIDTEGRSNEIVLDHEVRFSNLEEIIINDMKNLKRAWHYQFDRLKTLEINKCEKLESIFPSGSMQKALGSLETLKVCDCALLEEIFQMISNGTEEINVTTQLKSIVLRGLPKIKQIWTRDLQELVRFLSLQVVQIEGCENLEFVFPFSIAKDLAQLEHLELRSCGIKQVVSKKDGPIDENIIFELNRLTFLNLALLYKLKGFYAGAHTLECLSLKTLNVFHCKQLKLFDIGSNRYQESSFDRQLHFSKPQPLFTVEEVIGNLEVLTLGSGDADMILKHQVPRLLFSKLKYLSIFEDDKAFFPHWFLKNVPKFECLAVGFSSFKEIFDDETLTDEEGTNKINARLKALFLWDLPELQHLCREGSPIHPVLDVLKVLTVKECHGLRNLVPSSATFWHLEDLEITSCNSLIMLMTSSTARSLVKLRRMKLEECDSLEEIVKEEMDETKEMAFNSLLILELNHLPTLYSFSSSNCSLKFPLLERVVVSKCPRLQIFSTEATSTPKLKKVLKEEEIHGECYWEEDLDGTIKKMFLNKVAFPSFKHLELAKYPELKELWYGQVRYKLFCNLKSLVVKSCSWLSNILLSSSLLQALPNLEELEVRNCDTLEAVFDVEVLDDKENHVKEASQLKKLTLSGLPNLRYIWNKNVQEIFSFQNLQAVEIATCQNLRYLFSLSLCRDLQLLEKLHVESCGLEEIVAFEEGSENVKFDLPHLTVLELINLTQLKSLYPGRHTLDCPTLQTLYVYNCGMLQIFAVNHLNSQQTSTSRVNEVDMPIQQALVSLQKVNLKELALDEKDFMKILNCHYEANLFDSMEMLRLLCFQENSVRLLNRLLQRFPNITTLQVCYSSFKVLFPSEEIGYSSPKRPNQIRKLWLYQLAQLKQIWIDKYSLSDLLEELRVRDCPILACLGPPTPTISFTSLTALVVMNCKGLTFLTTPSTAKSLVRLKDLRVTNCEMMGEVVMIDDGVPEDITFESLHHLEMNYLPSFKSFSSGKHTFVFPSLEEVVITGCPKMQNFSSGVILTPNLTEVQVENNRRYLEEDLNTTIKQLFMEKVINC